MKFIIGFFMAWGNFITLPCPYKRWDNKLKNMMLSFLPLVGVVIGLIWMGLFWVVKWLMLPLPVASFIMIFYIFAICGFMHMDGFMDCNDAILSRRPLEERQRILKDSTVGAFAVVTVCFLLLAWYGCMSVAISRIHLLELLVIPVVSRGVAGLCVLSFKPIGHSQYVEDYKEASKGKYVVAIIALTLIVVAAVFFGNSMDFRPVAAAGVIAVSGFIACLYARRNLGGMSGDIAGYIICTGELAGIMTFTII